MQREDIRGGAGCVVIGIGNPLQGDDGVGVRAVEFLRGFLPEGVELVEGMVYGPDLLPFLEGRKKAIFIDAIDAGEEPGAVFRFSPGEVREERGTPSVSLHDFGLYELIAAARLLDQCPPDITVIAVQVKSLEVGAELSPEVDGALPQVCRLVLEELEKDSAGKDFLEVEITGIVQGVGFRPFVYRLAREHGLEGSVANTPEGARILAAGSEEALSSFLRAVREEAPPAAVIEDMRVRRIDAFEAQSFHIVGSRNEGEKVTLVSPDRSRWLANRS